MNSVDTEALGSEVSLEAASPSAGAMLKSAREASGLHIAALAVAMKVPVKKLEALEANRFDQMPDAVFVRALAAGVCRALKIDAAPIMERLPKSEIPRLGSDDKGINAPFSVPNNSHGIAVPDFFAKPAVLAVIALMVGALVLVLFPESQPAKVAGDTESVPLKNPVVAIGVGTNEKPADVIPNAQVVPPVAEQTPIALGANTPVVTPPPAGDSIAKADAIAPTTGVVSFKVRGTSWLEVKDAKGVMQLSATLKAGESATASGTFPLAVVIGRADVTDVEVRGKPFPLDAIAKDNVARFEVK